MQALETPSGPYQLVFGVKLIDSATKTQVDQGTYTLAEWNHHLLVKLSMKNLNRVLFFDGQKTLLTNESDSAFCYEGLTFSMLPLPLYMPYRFLSAQTYFPLTEFQNSISKTDLSKVPAELRDQLRKPTGSNISVKTGLSKSGDTYLPASLTSSPESAKLVVGPPAALFSEYLYEASTKIVGVNIPSRISVKVYEEVPGEFKRKESKVFKLTLAKHITDPKTFSKLTADDFLKAGMLVSYNGVTKQSGAIAYDRKEGTFDQQLTKMQSLPTGRESKPAASHTPSLAVPLTFAAVFAALSIFFLVSPSLRLRAKR